MVEIPFLSQVRPPPLEVVVAVRAVIRAMVDKPGMGFVAAA
jgi:hypothetical protein